MGMFKKFFGGSSRKDIVVQAAADAQRQQALLAMQKALVNPADSEAGKQAGEARLKKLARMRGVAGTRSGDRTGGSVAYKSLMGQ